MPKEYSLVVTPNATAGLANIVRYMEGRFSVKVANHFLSDFDEMLYLIKTRPTMFPVSNSSNKVRRALVNRLTSIYYKLEEDLITILAIEDNRKQQPLF